MVSLISLSSRQHWPRSLSFIWSLKVARLHRLKQITILSFEETRCEGCEDLKLVSREKSSQILMKRELFIVIDMGAAIET